MKNMHRRSFLKLSAAAAAAPLFSIGGNAAKPVTDRKIRLGLIGCGGRMGLSTRYGILNGFCDDCEIVCMAEPDPSRWDKIRAVVKAHQPATDVSKIATFYDYREMLAKLGGSLDAVAIATPNHHHAPAALRAMRLGLHVYVEKPMALTVAEVKLMRAAARKYGVIGQVGNHGHSEEGMRRLGHAPSRGVHPRGRDRAGARGVELRRPPQRDVGASPEGDAARRHGLGRLVRPRARV